MKPVQRYIGGGDVHKHSYLAQITRRLIASLKRGRRCGDTLEDLVTRAADLRQEEVALYTARKGTDGLNDYFSNVWSMARRYAAQDTIPEPDRERFLKLLRDTSHKRSNQSRSDQPRGHQETVTTGASWARGLEGRDGNV